MIIPVINYTIIFNTSVGFYNIRHYINSYIFSSLGRKSRYNNMYFLSADNPTESEKYFKGGVKTVENRIAPTLDRFYNILEGNEFEFISKQSNIFIYLTGHGCEEFLKVYNRNFIFYGNLHHSLKILSKKCNKIFLICDTCHAKSLLPSHTIHNLNVLFTSKLGEESMSSHYCRKQGIFYVDNFALAFQKNFNRNLLISDLLGKIEKEKIGSSLIFEGKDFKLNEFFY